MVKSKFKSENSEKKNKTQCSLKMKQEKMTLKLACLLYGV